MRARISSKMRRRVPIWMRLPAALQLKSMKHRALACRWHVRVYPAHHHYLFSIGLHTYLEVTDLSLSQKKVTNLDHRIQIYSNGLTNLNLRKIRIAQTALSSIPELDCFTVLGTGFL